MDNVDINEYPPRDFPIVECNVPTKEQVEAAEVKERDSLVKPKISKRRKDRVVDGGTIGGPIVDFAIKELIGAEQIEMAVCRVIQPTKNGKTGVLLNESGIQVSTPDNTYKTGSTVTVKYKGVLSEPSFKIVGVE